MKLFWISLLIICFLCIPVAAQPFVSSYNYYGEACGSNLYAQGIPAVGGGFLIYWDTYPNTTISVIMTGTRQVSIPSFGCKFLTSGEHSEYSFRNIKAFNIPGNPYLLGRILYQQVAVINSNSIVFTNGGEVVMGYFKIIE